MKKILLEVMAVAGGLALYDIGSHLVSYVSDKCKEDKTSEKKTTEHAEKTSDESLGFEIIKGHRQAGFK